MKFSFETLDVCFVEPQISHFANFTPCEELVPKRHFWQMVHFDYFGALISVLKFHIFLNFNCEEFVRTRVICEGLVRFFSDVKNWFSIFTNVKNRYQFFTPVKNWYSIFTNVKNHYQDIDFPLYKVPTYTLHSEVIFLSNPWYRTPPLVDHINISLKQEISLKKIFGGSQILTILTQLSDEIPLYSLSLHAGKGCSV